MAIWFESERLVFRDWEPDDLVPFARLCADPKVMEYFPSVLTREEAEITATRFQQEITSMKFGPWATARKSDGQFIGFVGLHQATFESHFTPCVEIGWRLSTDAWGHGYATEGALKCLHYGFKNLNLPQIYSFTATSNLRSENVMQKLGMRQIGHFEHPRVQVGSPIRRHVLYRITREEFEVAR